MRVAAKIAAIALAALVASGCVEVIAPKGDVECAATVEIQEGGIVKVELYNCEEVEV